MLGKIISKNMGKNERQTQQFCFSTSRVKKLKGGGNLKKISIMLLALSITILMITNVYASLTPPHPCGKGGKVTGGGQIENKEGGVSSFGINAMWFSRDFDDAPKGELNYVNHETGDKIHAHPLTYLVVWEENDPSNKPWNMRFAYFEGKCTVNHMGEYDFWVWVADDGEPASPDGFAIQVLDGSGGVLYENSNTLLHGNIQIHKPPK